MANFCRICHEAGRSRIDTLVTCNNCGSSACEKHYTWWPDSKNAFCTDCFPAALLDALERVSAGLDLVASPREIDEEEVATERQVAEIEDTRRWIAGAFREFDIDARTLAQNLRQVAKQLRMRLR